MAKFTFFGYLCKEYNRMTVETTDVIEKTGITFADMNLPEALINSLKAMDFSNPTPIQQESIPISMEGHDVLGSAQTGTGKTAAFSIPLVAKMLNNKRGTALVLCPTRELAQQVVTVIHQLVGRNSALKTALLIGGEPIFRQFNQLRARPRIIVGTPGRVNDHIERGSVRFDETSILVLDETDRMLDMGFGIQLDQILEHLPEAPTRQTLMFSATLPPEIVRLSDKYLNNPKRVKMGETKAPVLLKQDIIHLSQHEKYDKLLAELEARDGSVLIFVKTKRDADQLAYRISEVHEATEPLHGDLPQRRRTMVIKGFREKRFRILIATDIASRGLDISHIQHVINYDLPQCPEDYLHRVGRTARAGAEGSAVSFVSSDDSRKWQAIRRLLSPNDYKEIGKPAYGGGGGGGRYRQGGGRPGGNYQQKPSSFRRSW
jgi:ATP-dependent RNA helicase DeaD